jgi:hypothetical protein
MKLRALGAITVIVAIAQLYGAHHWLTASVLLALFLEIV